MSKSTGIEWTDSTWNPVTGCTKVSSGCDNCYAATLAHRLLHESYTRRLPIIDTTANRADPFAVRLWPERLDQPVHERSPRFIFVNSMSDLFHRDIPEEYLRDVFKVMLLADWHVFQVLTKRPSRALRFFQRNLDLFPSGRIPMHIWLGTSVENQQVAFRIRQLVAVPAEIRFVSCEPLLGPVLLELEGVSWVIAGGESGPRHRKMKLTWARQVRDQCLRSKIPFFFKQIGGRTPKAGGRLLDGRTWDQRPSLVQENATP
jgi:protein gp37